MAAKNEKSPDIIAAVKELAAAIRIQGTLFRRIHPSPLCDEATQVAEKRVVAALAAVGIGD